MGRRSRQRDYAQLVNDLEILKHLEEALRTSANDLDDPLIQEIRKTSEAYVWKYILMTFRLRPDRIPLQDFGGKLFGKNMVLITKEGLNRYLVEKLSYFSSLLKEALNEQPEVTAWLSTIPEKQVGAIAKALVNEDLVEYFSEEILRCLKLFKHLPAVDSHLEMVYEDNNGCGIEEI